MTTALTLFFTLWAMILCAIGIWLLAQPLRHRITPGARRVRPDLGGAALCGTAAFLLLMLARVCTALGGAA